MSTEKFNKNLHADIKNKLLSAQELVQAGESRRRLVFLRPAKDQPGHFSIAHGIQKIQLTLSA